MGPIAAVPGKLALGAGGTPAVVGIVAGEAGTDEAGGEAGAGEAPGRTLTVPPGRVFAGGATAGDVDVEVVAVGAGAEGVPGGTTTVVGTTGGSRDLSQAAKAHPAISGRLKNRAKGHRGETGISFLHERTGRGRCFEARDVPEPLSNSVRCAAPDVRA